MKEQCDKDGKWPGWPETKKESDEKVKAQDDISYELANLIGWHKPLKKGKKREPVLFNEQNGQLAPG